MGWASRVRAPPGRGRGLRRTDFEHPVTGRIVIPPVTDDLELFDYPAFAAEKSRSVSIRMTATVPPASGRPLDFS